MKLCVSIDLIVALRKEHKNARDISAPSKSKDIKLLLNGRLLSEIYQQRRQNKRLDETYEIAHSLSPYAVHLTSL